MPTIMFTASFYIGGKPAPAPVRSDLYSVLSDFRIVA